MRARVRRRRSLSEHIPPKVQRIWPVQGADGRFGGMRSSQVASTSPCPLASRTAVANSRSVRNRNSGRDCFTLDCFGAVPFAGFAAR